ncbi:hypothetical protein BDZ94DRAFT_1315584 [Collybia nuda]|uniref:Uncharacterized protein n=1 Tax=Collybia nuda TaxID=64659 RepID=A0A9P5XUN9_9AGAR|nr:hypothetical protein BDZ94DRAFT_1315584 [Collybia nuda]
MSGGPNPATGGKITVQTVTYGKTPSGVDFPSSYPQFKDAVSRPYVEWLKRVYPKEIHHNWGETLLNDDALIQIDNDRSGLGENLLKEFDDDILDRPTSLDADLNVIHHPLPPHNPISLPSLQYANSAATSIQPPSIDPALIDPALINASLDLNTTGSGSYEPRGKDNCPLSPGVPHETVHTTGLTECAGFFFPSSTSTLSAQTDPLPPTPTYTHAISSRLSETPNIQPSTTSRIPSSSSIIANNALPLPTPLTTLALPQPMVSPPLPVAHQFSDSPSSAVTLPLSIVRPPSIARPVVVSPCPSKVTPPPVSERPSVVSSPSTPPSMPPSTVTPLSTEGSSVIPMLPHTRPAIKPPRNATRPVPGLGRGHMTVQCGGNRGRFRTNANPGNSGDANSGNADVSGDTEESGLVQSLTSDGASDSDSVHSHSPKVLTRAQQARKLKTTPNIEYTSSHNTTSKQPLITLAGARSKRASILKRNPDGTDVALLAKGTRASTASEVATNKKRGASGSTRGSSCKQFVLSG